MLVSVRRENAGCHNHPTSGSPLKNHVYEDTQQPQVYRLPTAQFAQNIVQVWLASCVGLLACASNRRNTTGWSAMTRQIACDNCGGGFTPSEALDINISDPKTARYVCPKCLRGTDAFPPQQPIEGELPGIDHIEYTREKEEVIAACRFTNDAQLRFRETANGWIRQEVVHSDGETDNESLVIGRIDVDDSRTACHCLVETLAEYETYTAAGLRRHCPNIAAIVLGP
jgi:hypothetical protein